MFCNFTSKHTGALNQKIQIVGKNCHCFKMNMYMMATSRLEAVGYLCGILTWLGSMAVVSIPDWKHSILEKEGSYQGFIIARGLWSECTLKNTGSVECQRLNEPFFVLPITYRVCRVFTVSAVTFAFIAVVATPAGKNGK